MEAEDADSPLEPRLPTLDDLLFLCRSLNEADAKYIVIGGWAVIQLGFERTTSDIDLLVERIIARKFPKNQNRHA
jgi:hypothetical protein